MQFTELRTTFSIVLPALEVEPEPFELVEPFR